MTTRALTTLAAAALLIWGTVAGGCAAFEDRDQAASERTTTPGSETGQATGSSSPESASGAATSASPSGASGATPSASPYDSSTSGAMPSASPSDSGTSGGAAPSDAQPSASPQ